MSHIRFKNSALPSLVGEFFNRDNSEVFEHYHNRTIPAANILEKQDGFEIHLVAPGLKKENFSINLDENTLTISYKEEEKKEEEDEKFTRKEFRISSFKRSFNLNQLIDSENISATYVDGILKLSLPKKEEAKPKPERLIEIQ